MCKSKFPFKEGDEFMIGIYFSGTGNTKHCVEKLVKLLDVSAQSFPLEHTQMIQILEEHDIIVLGYPTQFSNAPIIVRDFIKNHSSLWNGKKVFCVNTSLSEIESIIRDSVEGHDFLLVAETDNKLIGYISAQKRQNESYRSFC